jgi:hypothetical protein
MQREGEIIQMKKFFNNGYANIILNIVLAVLVFSIELNTWIGIVVFILLLVSIVASVSMLVKQRRR